MVDLCPPGGHGVVPRIVNDYTRTHVFREYLTKTKKFAKPFLSVHMGQRSNLLSKKIVNNFVTLSF